MIKFSTITDYNTGARKTVVLGVGTTLFVRNESVQVMSDIWEYMNIAYYWDGERVCQQILGEGFECTVDADFDAILPQIEAVQLKRATEARNIKAEAEAARPDVKGRTVRVTRGKNAQGTEGVVVVVKEMYYGMGYRASLENKIAIALDDEMTTFTAKNGKQYPCHKNVVWVWARNCDVVNPTPDYAAAQHAALYDTKVYMDNIKTSCKV